MRLYLTDRWTNHLCDLPESGMGYQVVDVILRSGEAIKDIVVFNGHEVEWPEEKPPITPDEIVDIRMSGH